MTSRFTNWRKSRSSFSDEHCVEAGLSATGTIGVRDTKAGSKSPILEFTPAQWTAFTRGIRA